MLEADHAATAFQRVKRATQRGQQFTILRICTALRHGVGDGGQYLVGFISKDFQHFRVGAVRAVERHFRSRRRCHRCGDHQLFRHIRNWHDQRHGGHLGNIHNRQRHFRTHHITQQQVRCHRCHYIGKFCRPLPCRIHERRQRRQTLHQTLMLRRAAWCATRISVHITAASLGHGRGVSVAKHLQGPGGLPERLVQPGDGGRLAGIAKPGLQRQLDIPQHTSDFAMDQSGMLRVLSLLCGFIEQLRRCHRVQRLRRCHTHFQTRGHMLRAHSKTYSRLFIYRKHLINHQQGASALQRDRIAQFFLCVTQCACSIRQLQHQRGQCRLTQCLARLYQRARARFERSHARRVCDGFIPCRLQTCVGLPCGLDRLHAECRQRDFVHVERALQAVNLLCFTHTRCNRLCRGQQKQRFAQQGFRRFSRPLQQSSHLQIELRHQPAHQTICREAIVQQGVEHRTSHPPQAPRMIRSLRRLNARHSIGDLLQAHHIGFAQPLQQSGFQRTTHAA